MTYNFVPDDAELYSFKCNQHVLVEKEYIRHVRGFCNLVEEKYIPPFQYEPYPKVNSYYEFAEDYDAVNRLSHLLFETEESESISGELPSGFLCEYEEAVPEPPEPPRPEKIDSFMERLAQVHYLQTKPKCFVILGKPGLGEERLGRLLADYWRCVFISPEALIEEEIRSESRAGLCIEFNLRCGRAINADVIVRLLEQRMQSEIVKHRGFVLCGFPLIANNLYSEDPVSSESAIFTAQEIFEDLIGNMFPNDTVKHVSRTSLDSDGETEVEVPANRKRVSIKDHDPKAADNEPICYKSQNYDDNVNQMEFIMSLCEDHDYMIIYLKCANEEVVNIRQDIRYDYQTLQEMSVQRERMESIPYSGYSPQLEEQVYDERIAAGRRMLKIPRDVPAYVNVQLDRYLIDTQLVIEKYILLKHPEDVIRLDGRMSPNSLFRVLRLRLKVLPYGPSVNPELLTSSEVHFDSPGERTESPERFVQGEEANEATYLAYRNSKALGPLYTWNLSIWSYNCPVAMKEGFKIAGSSAFPVHFMNSIFFLSSDERCAKFLDNPRPYLLPPMPLTLRRFFIVQPEVCEVVGVAQCLRHFIDADIIEFSKIKARYFKTLKASKLADLHIEALKNMKEKRKRQCLENERKRLAKVRMYMFCIIKNLKDLQNVLSILSEYDGKETPKPQEILDAEESLEKMKNFKTLFNIETPKDCKKFIDDENLIMPFLPQQLKPPIVFEFDVVGPTSECVTREYKELLRKTVTNASNIDPEELARSVNELLAEANESIKNGKISGWILDGFPASVELIQLIDKNNMPDLIYILDDSSGGAALYSRRSIDMKFLQDLLQEPNPLSRRNSSNILRFSVDNLPDLDLEDIKTGVEKYLNELLLPLQEKLNGMECAYELIDIGGKPYKELLTDLVESYEGMYNRVVKVMTSEEKIQERANYGDHRDNESGEFSGEGGEGNWDIENFMENRRLGNTADYDPVAYSNGILWKGKEEFLVNYFNKMWLFANEEHMYQFIDAPHKYDRHIAFNARMPPMRICLVGNKGVGKTTQAVSLCKWLGLFSFDFPEVLKHTVGEDGVQAHLNNELDESVLQDLLFPFWQDPNKRAIGFVINGFPLTVKDVEFMIGNQLIPDCIIELDMDVRALKERLFECLLQEWRNQIGNTKENEQKTHEEQLEKWQAKRDREKAILLEERRDRYTRKSVPEGDESDRASLISYMSYEEARREMEVEAILQDQLPPPVLMDNWETEEQAMERIRMAVDEVQTFVTEPLRIAAANDNIPWHIVNGDMDKTRVYNSIMQFVMPYLDRNQSFFERAYDVSIEMAERLLENGYYFLSRFGKTCPVQMYENNNPLQMYVTNEAQFQLFPLIYSHYIYFLAGAENRLKFKKNILKYVQQNYVSLPLIRARLAVIGPPRAGKTTVAERLSREYGLEHISLGRSIRRALKYMPNSVMSKRVLRHLTKGQEVPLDLTMQCVEAMTFDEKAVALGFVLDGVPNSSEEVKRLAQMNLVPHLVVDLCTNLKYVFKVMDLFDPTHRPEYSKKFIEYRWDEWLSEARNFRKWLDAEYQNCATIKIKPSRWRTWGRVRDMVLAVMNEIKHYYRHCDRDMALRVTNMLVSPFEFVNRRSQFKNYCPLCLYYNNELTMEGMPPDRTGLVYYHDKFYWLCAEHIGEFEDDPDKFLGTNVRHELPIELPKPVEVTEIPDNVSLNGFCAICLIKSGGVGRTLRRGSIEHGALEYGGQVYLFDDPSCLDTFSRRPPNLSDLPSDITSDKAPAFDINSLPTMGMLEQYVASQVVDALIQVEAIRPVIAGLTIEQAALVSLGLLLKIKNPNTPPSHVVRYKQEKRKTMDAQIELKQMLKEAKETLNPYIHYQEPMPAFVATMKSNDVVDRLYIHQLVESLLDRIEYEEKKARSQADLVLKTSPTTPTIALF